jgi:hypothetical protein
MLNNVTIKPETNKVELTDQRRNVIVTDNRTGTSINLIQTNPAVLLINTPGPQGNSAIGTASGSFSGSFFGDGSGLTGLVASGSIDTASFALSGDGIFSGSYKGTVNTTDFTFEGDVLNVLGNVFVQGTLDASTKNFKINHPTLPGYYLVHSSLEGPERGMYFRGKLKTNDTIYLPDYWNELTDNTDITVQLTPIGNSCVHFVKSVNKQKIVVGCDCGIPHCFYIVHAQRYNEGKFNILQPKQTKSL